MITNIIKKKQNYNEICKFQIRQSSFGRQRSRSRSRSRSRTRNTPSDAGADVDHTFREIIYSLSIDFPTKTLNDRFSSYI